MYNIPIAQSLLICFCQNDIVSCPNKFNFCLWKLLSCLFCKTIHLPMKCFYIFFKVRAFWLFRGFTFYNNNAFIICGKNINLLCIIRIFKVIRHFKMPIRVHVCESHFSKKHPYLVLKLLIKRFIFFYSNKFRVGVFFELHPAFGG